MCDREKVKKKIEKTIVSAHRHELQRQAERRGKNDEIYISSSTADATLFKKINILRLYDSLFHPNLSYFSMSISKDKD